MEPRRRSHPLGISAVRTGLPAVLVLAAGVVLIVGPRGLAPGLLATAMFVIVADWIIRIAFSSQTDRDVEASARRRFARSGRWPEDDTPGTDDPDGDDDASSREAPHRSAPHDVPSGRASSSRGGRDRRPPRR
ncbi:MAG: hypothetical protein ITG02_06115 [Patulibacter sp.]|nr:hypothetical protein [Patulibacter sp.]